MNAIVCQSAEFKPGDPCPDGYLDRIEWHRVQQRHGNVQAFRPCCGLWLYGFEPCEHEEARHD